MSHWCLRKNFLGDLLVNFLNFRECGDKNFQTDYPQVDSGPNAWFLWPGDSVLHHLTTLQWQEPPSFFVMSTLGHYISQLPLHVGGTLWLSSANGMWVKVLSPLLGLVNEKPSPSAPGSISFSICSWMQIRKMSQKMQSHMGKGAEVPE